MTLRGYNFLFIAIMKTLEFLAVLLVLNIGIADANRARAKGAIALVADVVYKSPPNNDFIYMIENSMMDTGIVSLVEGMAVKYASSTACSQFQKEAAGGLSAGPVGRRAVSSQPDSEIVSEILNILDSSEGEEVIAEVAEGKHVDIPAPKYNSGGFNRGKRQDENELLSILDGPEGKELIDQVAEGKSVTVPPPKYNSGGFGQPIGKRQTKDELINILDSKEGKVIISDEIGGLGYHPNTAERFRRDFFEKRQTQTHHINIHTGEGMAAGSTKPAALMARVRNVIVNKYSLQLFLEAYDDGTMRQAMYNICKCNAIASNIRYFYNLGR